MVRIKAEPDNFDNVNMTMTITMTFADWKQFSEQIKDSYPGFKIMHQIREVMNKVGRQVVETIEEPK